MGGGAGMRKKGQNQCLLGVSHVYGTPMCMCKDWMAWPGESDGRSPRFFFLLISMNKMISCISGQSKVLNKCQFLSPQTTDYRHLDIIILFFFPE